MANIKSAKKAAVQSEKRRVINLARRSSVKTAVKSLLNAIDAKADVAMVQNLFREAEAKIARSKNKIMHANTASRKVSRLAQRVSAYAKGLNS
jgi:small subunit ribosomal protein S20